MSKESGFLEYKRRDPGYRQKDSRLKDHKAVELRLTDEELFQQASRCMDCGIPFCHGCGCPLSNVIPELNELVYKRKWKKALEILLSTNPFPEFTGRVCPALCEGSCVLGIHEEPVTIRQIEIAIVEKAFELGYLAARPPSARSAMRVAVVGSGPAGLAAAYSLNKRGHNVTVYESAAKPGGILQYGIPEFKLEKWVVDRRLRLMKEEGVVFETGVEAGKDVSGAFLRSRFDAIVLAGGAREPRDLKIPGRELKGVHFALPYLIQQNKRLGGEPIQPEEEISAEGRTVAIIGGGDTGADCLGTALRQGAKKVYQLEILPRPPATRDAETPWPMWPNMLRESSSHKEGGERRWSVATKEFIGEDGRVKQLRCVEVEWAKPRGGGAPAPVEKPGTEFVVDADLALLAMGFVGPARNKIADELKVELDRRGFIKRDENNMTSVPGIFVAGDMTLGASLVVRAIADGIAAAKGVAEFLAKRL